MMDWEEEERIRQEKRERRRRVHEKLAATGRPGVEAKKTTGGATKAKSDADTTRPQENTQVNNETAKNGQGKSYNKKTKPKKKAAKKKLKWPLGKLASKRKSQAKENNQTQTNRQLERPSQDLPPAKKVKKTGRTNWKKMTLLLLPFIIVLFVAGYYASPLNHVASINVEGVEEADSVKLYPLKEGVSVRDLKNTKGEVEQAIVNQNPSVKSATVNISDWNQVTVNVSAYRQMGYIQIADFFYPLLENNKIIDTPLPSLEKELPLFEGYDIANEDERAKLTETIKAFSSLPDDIIQQMSLVTYTGDENNDDRIALQMADGNVVRGFISTIGDRMSYYNGIASQLDGQTGLIDMEVAIYFTELNDGNNPYASAEDKKAYDESVAAESSAASESEASALELDAEAASSESAESSEGQSESADSQIESSEEASESSSVDATTTSENTSSTSSGT